VVLQCDAAGIVLRAHFNVDLVDLGFTTFRRGDEFVEFYYWDRPYNVFQVSEPDGTLKGWYANVGLPAELEGDSPISPPCLDAVAPEALRCRLSGEAVRFGDVAPSVPRRGARVRVV